MPYILPYRRGIIKLCTSEDLSAPGHFRVGLPRTEGDLNYVMTTLIDNYISRIGCTYPTLNSLIGVLACMQQELYRRVVAPYEDEKIRINGDAFTTVPESASKTGGKVE